MLNEVTKVLVVMLCVLSILLVGTCKIEAYKRSKLEDEVQRNHAEIDRLENDNRTLQTAIQRSNDALLKAGEAVERAINANDKRTEILDDVNVDWLLCPLPDGVREAFNADYCSDSATKPAGAVRVSRENNN